jgi:hypothetical protein
MGTDKNRLLLLFLVTSIFFVLLISNKELEIESIYPPISPVTDDSISDSGVINPKLDIPVSATIPLMVFNFDTISTRRHFVEEIDTNGKEFAILYLSSIIPPPRSDIIPIC